MGETMRYRMARAICREQLGWIATEEEVERFTPRWLKHADAALAAMREPTESMLRALPYEPFPSPAEKRDATMDWQAMIDAARDEQPDEEADVERSN
jgi:hypothetical protein